jgi:hypothetical protein
MIESLIGSPQAWQAYYRKWIQPFTILLTNEDQGYLKFIGLIFCLSGMAGVYSKKGSILY